MIMAEVFYCHMHLVFMSVGGVEQDVHASVLRKEVTGQLTGISSLFAMRVFRGSLRSSALVAIPC